MFNFDTNNINIYFKQNTNNVSSKFSLLVSQYVTETLLAAASAIQLNMIDIQTIFIKMWIIIIIFNYDYSFKASILLYLLSALLF